MLQYSFSCACFFNCVYVDCCMIGVIKNINYTLKNNYANHYVNFAWDGTVLVALQF